MNMIRKKQTCCICGAKFTGCGNDPWPLRDEGRCCKTCDSLLVLPARVIEFCSRTEADEALEDSTARKYH